MKYVLVAIVGLILYSGSVYSQTTYPNNEDGQFEDILTPQYYLSQDGDPFRNDMNKFIHFARKVPFQHPLQNTAGHMPQYRTPEMGKFGAGKGRARIIEAPRRKQRGMRSQDSIPSCDGFTYSKPGN